MRPFSAPAILLCIVQTPMHEAGASNDEGENQASQA